MKDVIAIGLQLGIGAGEQLLQLAILGIGGLLEPRDRLRPGLGALEGGQ